MSVIKKLNDLELKKDELRKVVDSANQFKVNHTSIAKSVGISYKYLRQIIKGDRLTVDTDDNRKLVQSLIDAYRKDLRDKKEILASIDVEPEEVH